MTETGNIDVIAQTCLEANEVIQADGTPMMKTLIRLLLFEIGEEIRRREADRQATLNGE